MKNLDIKITILGMILFNVGLMGIIGCKQVTPPPPKPVNDTSERALFYTGTILNIHYYGYGNIKFFHRVQFNFADGSVIKMDRMECDHLPKIGEHGKLYIQSGWDGKSISDVQRGDYLWIRSGKKKRITIKIPMEETTVEEIAKVSEQQGWQDANNSSPNVYQLVLIKLSNKLITTGRFNEHNEWQIETDKGRSSFNKYPRFKVIEWKEFNKD